MHDTQLNPSQQIQKGDVVLAVNIPHQLVDIILGLSHVIMAVDLPSVYC